VGLYLKITSSTNSLKPGSIKECGVICSTGGDASGHEIDVLADHGSFDVGVELKSGMTVVPDFF
jgi:hypothetical protein